MTRATTGFPRFFLLILFIPFFFQSVIYRCNNGIIFFKMSTLRMGEEEEEDESQVNRAIKQVSFCCCCCCCYCSNCRLQPINTGHSLSVCLLVWRWRWLFSLDASGSNCMSNMHDCSSSAVCVQYCTVYSTKNTEQYTTRIENKVRAWLPFLSTVLVRLVVVVPCRGGGGERETTLDKSQQVCCELCTVFAVFWWEKRFRDW